MGVNGGGSGASVSVCMCARAVRFATVRRGQYRAGQCRRSKQRQRRIVWRPCLVSSTGREQSLSHPIGGSRARPLSGVEERFGTSSARMPSRVILPHGWYVPRCVLEHGLVRALPAQLQRMTAERLSPRCACALHAGPRPADDPRCSSETACPATGVSWNRMSTPSDAET